MLYEETKNVSWFVGYEVWVSSDQDFELAADTTQRLYG